MYQLFHWIHYFNNHFLVETFGYYPAIHIKDTIDDLAAFLLGTLVAVFLVASSIKNVESMPDNVMKKAQIIVINEHGHRVVYRKKIKSFKEAFFMIVGLVYVRLRNFRGEFFYKRIKTLTFIYWFFTILLAFYFLITILWNWDVIEPPGVHALPFWDHTGH